MARPVKWARDVHRIRDQISRSRTETWSRKDIEHVFHIGRASSQTLMKAVGAVQVVGGTHFVDRGSLLEFLDAMAAATSIEDALRARLEHAEPPPRPKALRVALPAELRHAMMPDLPANITLEPGRLEVRADCASAMLESLVTLAMIMQNDLDRFQNAIEPPLEGVADEELRSMFARLREHANLLPEVNEHLP